MSPIALVIVVAATVSAADVPPVPSLPAAPRAVPTAVVAKTPAAFVEDQRPGSVPALAVVVAPTPVEPPARALASDWLADVDRESAAHATPDRAAVAEETYVAQRIALLHPRQSILPALIVLFAGASAWLFARSRRWLREAPVETTKLVSKTGRVTVAIGKDTAKYIRTTKVIRRTPA